MNEFPKLTHFFSSYFHQDWQYEYETESWEQLVVRYADDDGIAAVASTCAELSLLINSNRADLDDFILNELGCYFYPPARGQATADWLRQVSAELERVRVSESKT